MSGFQRDDMQRSEFAATTLDFASYSTSAALYDFYIAFNRIETLQNASIQTLWWWLDRGHETYKIYKF